MNQTFLIVLDGVLLSAPKELTSFIIEKRDSSNVDYFAYDEVSLRLYIQFKSGVGYMYSNVALSSLEVLKKFDTSVGAFVNSYLKGLKFEKTDFSIKAADLKEVANEYNWMKVKETETAKKQYKEDENF